MNRLRRTLCSAAALSILGGCSSAPIASSVDTRAAPELVERLPKELEGFKYDSYKYVDAERTDTYRIRYLGENNFKAAELFVYPVMDSNRDLAHPELVFGALRTAAESLMRSETYANVSIVDSSWKELESGATLGRLRVTYLYQNLAFYSSVYQSELDGVLITLRVTVPDNAANRGSVKWDAVADALIGAALGAD